MTTTVTSIDVDVSDLFFNRDLSDAVNDDGTWHMETLKVEAEMFLGSIERLTGQTYLVDDLITDFFNRM